MPRSGAAFIEYGQIRRVEEQQMEFFLADPVEKETAETHSMQACLRFFHPACIQLYAISEAVISLGNLPQRHTAAAAWVKQICCDALREPDTPQDMSNVAGVSGVVAHSDVIHQSPDNSGIGRPVHREFSGKIPQYIVHGPVCRTHKIKTQQSRSQLSRDRGQ